MDRLKTNDTHLHGTSKRSCKVNSELGGINFHIADENINHKFRRQKKKKKEFEKDVTSFSPHPDVAFFLKRRDRHVSVSPKMCGDPSNCVSPPQ